MRKRFIVLCFVVCLGIFGVSGCKAMEEPIGIVAEQDTGKILADALGTEDVQGFVSGLSSAGIEHIDRAAKLGSGVLGILSDGVEYEVHFGPDGTVTSIRDLGTGKVWTSSGR